MVGLYGLGKEKRAGGTPGSVRAVLAQVERVAESVAGAWVEDKGDLVAVHFRSAPDSRSAERELEPPLSDLARRHGLALLPGKMVLELVPADTPGKGAVVQAECRVRGLTGCLYAGDDRADLSAFEALDQLRSEGAETLKIAVRSEETPEELLRAADLVVERPAGLAAFLARL